MSLAVFGDFDSFVPIPAVLITGINDGFQINLVVRGNDLLDQFELIRIGGVYLSSLLHDLFLFLVEKILFFPL